MKDLVEYLDEYVEELRNELMSPKNKRDDRWKKRPPNIHEGKRLPFRKGAKWGKLGLQMGVEALTTWVREHKMDFERGKPKDRV